MPRAPLRRLRPRRARPHPRPRHFQRHPEPVRADQEVRGLSAIAEKIPVHFQSRFLELVKETHPLEWREIVFALLKTSQGKFTTECINFLIENGQSDELAAALKRWKTEQNLRAPVLLWVIKNRHSKKFSKLLNELVTPRLLGAIFFAIDYEALQSAGTRRIPLGEALSDDPEPHFRPARHRRHRDGPRPGQQPPAQPGLRELTKKSLLARFIKLFPSLQSLVSGDAETKDEQFLVSREELRAQAGRVRGHRLPPHPDNSKAIATAREHGDLRENSEFKMAKQDQGVLMGQKAQLERDLARARITDFTSDDSLSGAAAIVASAVTSGRSYDGADADLVGRGLGEIGDAGAGEVALELRLLAHEDALVLLGHLELGVLAEIAVFAGGGDGLGVVRDAAETMSSYSTRLRS